MGLKQKKLTETYPEVKQQAGKRKSKSLVDENHDREESFQASGVALDEFPKLVKNGESGVDAFYLAKKALHTSKPSKLPCRDPQIQDVHRFLTQHLSEKNPGTLYISGAPGTGKTAVVQHVLSLLTAPEKGKGVPFIEVFINCMNLANSALVFEHIYGQLVPGKRKVAKSDMKDVLIKKMTSKTGRMIVLILDEIDHLLSSNSANNEVLYTIFQWARLPNSKLILIGVANALDLTVRHLPMLLSSPKPSAPKSRMRGGANSSSVKGADGFDPECQVMNFPPYEREDIASILEDRLSATGGDVFDPAAIKFVAGKVAASTGDMRKALNACKMALDTMEKQERQVLKQTADDGFNSSSPKKSCIRPGERVGVVAISKALAPQKDEGGLPTQQQLILATLLRVHRRAPNSKVNPNDGVMSAVPVSSLYDEYRQVCHEKGFSWIDRSEMVSVCAMLEDRSLVSLTQGSGTPSSASKRGTPNAKGKNKVGLFFDPKAAETALRHGDFLKSIVEG